MKITAKRLDESTKDRIVQMRIDNPGWSYAEIGRQFISEYKPNGISREYVRQVLSMVDL